MGGGGLRGRRDRAGVEPSHGGGRHVRTETALSPSAPSVQIGFLLSPLQTLAVAVSDTRARTRDLA